LISHQKKVPAKVFVEKKGTIGKRTRQRGRKIRFVSGSIETRDQAACVCEFRVREKNGARARLALKKRRKRD